MCKAPRIFFFYCYTNLEHFDLARGGVEMLCVLSILILFKCVNLDAERDPLLSSMLAHGKLCADAMNLKKAWKLILFENYHRK